MGHGENLAPAGIVAWRLGHMALGEAKRGMNPDRWQKLKSILAEALEQDSVSVRRAVIDRSCANDIDLLREIESLLAETDTTDTLDDCADHLAVAAPTEGVPDIGRRVGAYVIIREIGQGGMGTVYLAARADGCFEKQVAIKILNRGAASEDALRRFRAEREVLARLDHPNIARLIDAGTMDDGRPYFVMEYVDGVPITRFVEETAKNIPDRLNLFLKVGAAVETAHHNSVIHRDLKPNNILVNDQGEPKLLDFGIAKVMGSNTNPLEITSFRLQRLTPSSASPEQVRGQPVTIFSDIYALGVVLYEMLTGVRPHRFETSYPTDEELVKVVCDQLPSPPSQAINDRARQRQLRGNLDAIALCALQKEPGERYASVADFTEDIRRHLVGKPVQARGSKKGYRIRTAISHDRRIRITAAALTLCLLGLGLGFGLRSYLNKAFGARTASDAQSLDNSSIAVLPFENLAADKESGYFADGVQEAILTDLANVSALKVISRGSVASYRVKQRNAREIGEALGVSHLLEGSVQRTGDRVRVDAQLIDTRTATAVWAQQYDRKLDDLFEVESDLAQAIVAQLKSELSADEKAAIESRPTKDMLAYDFYLRAHESFFQNNCANSARLLEQAVARDPQFALAYSSLAEVHLYIYRFNGDRTSDRLAQAQQAADTALRLAPKLPQSHLARAQYYYYGLRDFERALGELNAARSVGGEQAAFVDLAALIERRLGRWKDAIRDGERASELDPHNPFVINELIESYIAVRRFPEAERVANKAIGSGITREGRLWGLRAEALLDMGQLDQARNVMQSAPEDMTRMSQRVWVELFAGDFAKASQVLQTVSPVEKDSFLAAYFEGSIARVQGNIAQARTSFQIARERVLAQLKERPNDPELISNLSVTDAGLGHTEAAVQEGRKAVELCPISRDAVDGPMYDAMLAMVYAWVGERDAALAELQRLVKFPRSPNWAELHFSPMWNDVRNDSRFDSILAQAALPPEYQ